MKLAKVALLACGIALTLPSLAGAVVINGDTTGGPTYNRPLAGAPPSGLSGVGIAVSYQLTSFTVSDSGSYDFLSTALYDNFLGLHANAFDPLNPLSNALIYNDDFPGIGLSGFSVSLLAGVSYLAIATGFADTDFGTYTLTITGPGAIELGTGGVVPEPAAWALMIVGFGMVGATMRRRASVARVSA